jgi:hypothetical protein
MSRATRSRRAKIIDVKWLGNVIDGAHARGGYGRVDGPVLREHQNGDLRIHFVNLFQKIEAARGGQDQVRDDDIDGVSFQPPECFLHRAGHDRFHATGFRHVRAEFPRSLFVFHNEHAYRNRGALYGGFFGHRHSPCGNLLRGFQLQTECQIRKKVRFIHNTIS